MIYMDELEDWIQYLEEEWINIMGIPEFIRNSNWMKGGKNGKEK